MASVSNPPPLLPEISDAQRQALERILASATFSNAPRLRAVLSFLIEGFLAGRTDELSEQNIGQAVFGRPVGYNPGDDNIVRVTVRHLRMRLEEFYRTEGREEVFLLEIPKGKYIPLFVSRSVSQDLPSAASPFRGQAVHPVPRPLDFAETLDLTPSHFETVDPLVSRLTTRRSVWWLGLLSVVCLLLLGYFLIWSHQSSAVKESATSILGAVVVDQNSVLVVVADSNLQAYREIFGKQVPLASYINRSYTQVRPDTVNPNLLGAWQYSIGSAETNVSSAIIAAGIKHNLLAKTVIIKHPHDVSMRDFQEMDIVLLGGPWINPWGQLFEGRLNFRMLPIETNTSMSEVHNFNPQPGEPADFVPHAEGNLNVNYVRIALLPNFRDTGSVVLVGATSPEALEAGGAYLISPESLVDLRRRFHFTDGKALTFFEVVLEVRGLQSVPGTVHIIAQRLVNER